MNQEDFVESIRRYVRDAGIDGVGRILEAPPGRSPPSDLLELSAWYSHLADEDKARLRRVMALVADHVVFGMFAVLDGVRTLEPVGAKGDFRLTYVDPTGVETPLTGDGSRPLHELL